MHNISRRIGLNIARHFPLLMPENRGGLHSYLLTVALMGLALWLRLGIAPISAGLQYVTFFPAVTLAAILGGYRAGFLATAIGLILATYIFTPPYYSISTDVLRASLWSNMVFLTDGIIISVAIEAMHRFREKYSRELRKSIEAHATLEINTRHVQRILDNLFSYVALLETNGRILEVNKAPLERAGLRREDVIGQFFYDAPWWAYDNKVQSQLKESIQAARQGQTRRYDVVVSMGNDLVPIDFQISPVCDEQGQIIGLLPTAVDITERKEIEDALRESENKFRVLFDSSSDCLILLSLNGYILDINRIGHERLGYTKEEMVGRRIAEFDPPEFADKVPERVARIMRDGQATFESVHILKNGSRMPVEINSRQIELNGERILFSSIRDITKRKQAEDALLASEANLHAMLDNSPYLTWLKDAGGRYITINKVFADYLRLADVRQVVGKTDMDLHPKELAEKYRADDAEVMATRQQKHVEEPAFDGADIHWVETFKTPIIGAHGQVMGTVGFAGDITERKNTEEALRVAAVTFETHDAIVITDSKSNIIRVNRAFTDITGYSLEEVLGKNPRIMSSGRQDKTFYIEMWQQLLHTGSWAGEIWDRRKNGQVYPKWLTITAVKNERQETTHYVAIFSDITARKQSEEEIRNMAFYDSLTKLPNRRLFLDRFRAALTISARRNDYGAVMFIDMDRFKMLNDTLGHDYGDLLLIEVSTRIKSCVREMDTVARLGGDEFVVLIEGISTDQDEASRKIGPIAEKIRDTLAQSYKLKSHEHHCSPSIGISLYRGNEKPVDDLIQQADMAMYQAKESGRNAVRFFDPLMQAKVSNRASLENDLHAAIAEGQLHLYYQIQMDNHRPIGAEALLRWIHPVRGTVLPGEFIPIAEEGTLILDIGHWVLNAGCRQLAQWALKPKMNGLTLALNVSAKQFAQPDFVEQVTHLLQRHKINPALLKFELTESLVLNDQANMIKKMHELRNLGIQLSMDDFGTGYSSLSYLKDLPLDQIKIDQGFVQGITKNGSNAMLVQTIIDLAKNFSLNVIAEGVETDAQLTFLKHHDCFAYQGYLFSKPLSIEEFEALL